MTDGILLRQLSNAASGAEMLLQEYSCIIIDEAHERGVGTDVLIGWLSRIVKLRSETACPLKVVIMSATLATSDFCENKRLFPTAPPILHVPGRQFKVVVHFQKRTPVNDGLNQVVKKIAKIHTRLPRGGILVFLSGRNEIKWVVQELETMFGRDKEREDAEEEDEEASFSQGVEDLFDPVSLDCVDEFKEDDVDDSGSEDENIVEMDGEDAEEEENEQEPVRGEFVY